MASNGELFWSFFGAFLELVRPLTKDKDFLASLPEAPGSILGLGLEIYRQRCCLDVNSRGLKMSNEPSITSWWQARTTKKKKELSS